MDEASDVKSKLWGLDEAGEFVPHVWGKGYQIQQFSWGSRLLCSTDENRIDFLMRLVARYPGPYNVTYILEDDDRTPDHKRGRYWSPDAFTREQVAYFLDEFRDFLEFDGRHHLMISSPASTGNVIYDQHDYFFVYGGLEPLIQELVAEGYRPREYALDRHGHRIESDQSTFHRLMRFRNWHWTPLEATDTTRDRSGPIEFARMKLRAWWFDRTKRAPD